MDIIYLQVHFQCVKYVEFVQTVHLEKRRED